MGRVWRGALAALIWLGMGGPAAAAVVDCRSVLAQSSLWTPEFRQHSAVQLITYSRFLRLDAGTAANDAATGFGVPAGQVVFGGPFDASRHQLRKEYLSAALFNYVVPERREMDAALASGLPDVLAAWKACAASQGGLAIRFELQSPRDAIAFIELYGPAGSEATLLGDSSLPVGVTAMTGADCLKAGRVIKAGQPCVMVLSLPDATTTLLLAVNTDQGLPIGYLPARVKLSAEKRPFRFTPDCELTANASSQDTARCRDRLWKGVSGQSALASHTVTLPGSLPNDMLGQGWEFDTTTGGFEIVVLARYSPSNTTRCDNKVVQPSPMAFTYGYRLKTGIEHHQAASITCMVRPAIDLTRPVWIPQV